MRIFRFFLILSFAITVKKSIAQIPGCTDNRANNYDSKATINNGSCLYDPTTTIPVKVIDKLSDTINATSALMNMDGELWSLNDGGYANAIYHFDKTDGHILQTIFIRNTANYDWEALAIDQNYIYIANTGNNFGNRTNMAIYRVARNLIPKKAVDTVDAQIMFISYADQTDYTSRLNNHKYDCDAMVVIHDTLHLFSRDWVDGWTKHYMFPAAPGIYSLSPQDSMATGCLISDAVYEPSSGRIVLSGYTQLGACYIWMLWNYHGNKVFSGNKRRIDLGTFFDSGQIEGICFKDSNTIYLTNENYIVNNKLMQVNVGWWMNPRTAGIKPTIDLTAALNLQPNPSSSKIEVQYHLSQKENAWYTVFGMDGKIIFEFAGEEEPGNIKREINIDDLDKGIYILQVSTKNFSARKTFIKI